MSSALSASSNKISSATNNPNVPNPFIPARLVIPTHSGGDNMLPMEISPPSTPIGECGVDSVSSSYQENVGRWSENEHKVFLEGLEKYGKQWKTIATMIGTRTVVQVRTHAQKYFQKMDRKTKPSQNVPTSESTVTDDSVASPSSPAQKRKSLPAVMPSRKKTKSPKKARSTSVSLSQYPASPPPQLSNIVSYSSTCFENMCASSPTSVNDIDLHLSYNGQYSLPKSDSALFLDCDSFHNEENVVSEEDDPLEWLIGDGIDHLPESSLEHAPMISTFDANEYSYPASYAAGFYTDEMKRHEYYADVNDNLNITDPKVTVQSLFLESEF